MVKFGAHQYCIWANYGKAVFLFMLSILQFFFWWFRFLFYEHEPCFLDKVWILVYFWMNPKAFIKAKLHHTLWLVIQAFWNMPMFIMFKNIINIGLCKLFTKLSISRSKYGFQKQGPSNYHLCIWSAKSITNIESVPYIGGYSWVCV